MEPSILSLPTELKRHIVELSSDSPSSLAALARTHTTYQREAERVLYHTLSIHTASDDSLKCMENLATNSEKAALVHVLIIKYVRYNKKKSRRVEGYLSRSLINMHSLSDFRLLSCGSMFNPDLYRFLGLGHLRLRTLYCHDVQVLAISRIIKCQPELQILGLCISEADQDRPILKTLKELHNAQLFFPIVFSLEKTNYISLSIFPAFYSVDRRATIHQVLAQSLSKDQNNYMLCDVRVLCIYLIDSSDMPTVYALVKDMAVIFPQVIWVHLYFERRCEIPPQEIKEEISFFSNLRKVDTYVWSIPNLPEDG